MSSNHCTACLKYIQNNALCHHYAIMYMYFYIYIHTHTQTNNRDG